MPDVVHNCSTSRPFSKTEIHQMNIDRLIPENIKHLKSYVAGKTIAEVMEVHRPTRIAKLASNENRMGFSPNVTHAIAEASKYIQDYPDPVSQKLRKKLAEYHSVGQEEVMITAGSESMISVICRTFFKANEYAVTADATFVGFYVQAGVKGIEVKKIPITENYSFDVDGIIDSVKEGVKLVYIANPNNPTGTYIPTSDYIKLIEGIPKNVLIIADEAYFEYASEIEDYPKAMDYRRENVIILRTFSKAYGLAGLRVGYGIAHPDLITQMTKTRLTFEPTTLAQAAAVAALDDSEFIKTSVERVKKGREQLYRFFDEHEVKYVKSISNSVLMVCDDEQSAKKITQSMLEQGVILRRTQAFGLPNCIRITIGTEEDMQHFEQSYMNIAEEIYS